MALVATDAAAKPAMVRVGSAVGTGGAGLGGAGGLGGSVMGGLPGTTQPGMTGYISNAYGTPDFTALVQPQWNVATPYDAMIQQAKGYLYTPQQLRGIAGQQTNAQTNAQLGAINASYAQQLAYLGAMQNRSAGLAQALGDFGPGYASAVQNIYDNAAQTMAAVGPGVVAQGQQQMQGNLDAAKAAVAAKTGGQGQVTTYNPTDIANTLSTTGVQMPGNALALSGANAAQLSLWGANADKAQMQNIVDYYNQQQTQALQQRTADRAQIIAQRPEIFQNALEAQRQDNYQTQNRIDNLVGQATNYVIQRNQIRMQQAQNLTEWGLAQMTATHISPWTHQPVGGYVWAPGSHKTVAVPYTAVTQAQHWQDQNTYWQGRIQSYNQNYNLQQRKLNMQAATANNPGKFDKNMSTAVGYISDSFGRPIMRSKDGQPQPYKSPTASAKPMSSLDQLKIQGTLGNVAESFKNGAHDPKTGVQTQAPIDIMSAIQKMSALGYFTNPQIRNWAFNALGSAYGYTVPQVQQIASGVDPATGGAYGAGPTGSATGYGPYQTTTTPAGAGAGSSGNISQPIHKAITSTIPNAIGQQAGDIASRIWKGWQGIGL